MRNTGLLGRLQLGGLAVGRALFAQNLLGRVLALAAVCADTEALAQVVQAAPEPGAVANLAFGDRIADTNIHVRGDIVIEEMRMSITRE